MTDDRTELTKDPRPITEVHWIAGSGGHSIGYHGVTKIEAYCECGHWSMIPWIAVYKGDQIWIRFPADAVSIYYKVGDEAKEPF